MRVYIDVMLSLTSKDETLQKMSKTTEDKEKTLRGQLAELQTKSKHRIGDLTSQVEQLEAEVARRMVEVERLSESLSAVTKTNEENKVLIYYIVYIFVNPSVCVFYFIFIFYKKLFCFILIMMDWVCFRLGWRQLGHN